MPRPAPPLLQALALASAALLAACGGGGTPSGAEAAAPPPPPVADVATAQPAEQARAPGDDGTEVPVRFQGRYAADADACTVRGHESGLELRADSIRFHEGSGPVRSVSAQGNMLTLVAELTGEGEMREAAYQFGLSEDGSSLHDLANGLARRRCD